MARRRRLRPGPESVWRILRQMAQESRQHEEWRRRIEVEEAARRREREAQEAARQRERDEQQEARQWERDEQEKAWRQERKERDVQAAAELKALRRAVHRMIGDGDARFGRLMEALTEGDLIPLLQGAGYPVYGELVRRRGISRNGITVAEMDLVALGDAVSVGVEVKTTLRPEYVRHFVGKMERFRDLFPDCSRETVHGAMAYLTATESAPMMALRRGLLLIRVVGSSASIVSPPEFEPRNF